MSQKEAKIKTAHRAAEFVEPGMTVGIGSGTTAAIFIEHLAQRVKAGLNIRGICSSTVSEKLARESGIPITDFHSHQVIDLAIDGADQIGPGLALIKGGGGFLLREKIVISAARRFIVIADHTKLVPQLGAGILPIEVIQMAAPLIEPKLRALGLEPKRRDYVTEEGNWILDCYSEPIADPEKLQHEIRNMIGVVEHGLFLNMANQAIISDGESVWEI